MFVKWQCGCVGLRFDQQDPKNDVGPCCLVIDSCSRDCEDNQISFNAGHRHDKEFEPLPLVDAFRLIQEISYLIYNGYDLRDVQRSLGCDVQRMWWWGHHLSKEGQKKVDEGFSSFVLEAALRPPTKTESTTSDSPATEKSASPETPT
jgi:hypothetical protein